MMNPVNHDSSSPQASFVALFDVLGCKNRLETTPLATVSTEDVIKYVIPVKKEAPALDYAIHWGPYATGAKTILESLINEANDSSVKAKYEATIGYLKAHCSSCHAWT